MKYLVALLAVAGIVVSAMALHVHYMDPSQAPPCAVTEKFDCGAVNHSRFAVFPPRTFDEPADRGASHSRRDHRHRRLCADRGLRSGRMVVARVSGIAHRFSLRMFFELPRGLRPREMVHLLLMVAVHTHGDPAGDRNHACPADHAYTAPHDRWKGRTQPNVAQGADAACRTITPHKRGSCRSPTATSRRRPQANGPARLPWPSWPKGSRPISARSTKAHASLYRQLQEQGAQLAVVGDDVRQHSRIARSVRAPRGGAGAEGRLAQPLDQDWRQPDHGSAAHHPWTPAQKVVHPPCAKSVKYPHGNQPRTSARLLQKRRPDRHRHGGRCDPPPPASGGRGQLHHRPQHQLHQLLHRVLQLLRLLSPAQGHDGLEGYILDYETIYQKIQETIDLGGTGVLMQGGLHPDLKIDWYRGPLPRHQASASHPSGCTASRRREILDIAEYSELSLRDTIARLRDAGLRVHPRRRRRDSRRRRAPSHQPPEVHRPRTGSTSIAPRTSSACGPPRP